MYGANASSKVARNVVVLTTLGFYVVLLYRLASKLQRLGGVGKFLARLVALLMNVASGCYISPKAKIGPGLYLPHPVGIVIGDGVIIGSGVSIYQHVTLGSSDRGANAYPALGDHCRVFAGAVIVGQIEIGPRAVVGASAVVLRSIPAGAKAVGNPARVIG